jgi:hypothetical protein
MPLPRRYWRWTWLSLVLRLVIGVPFFLAAIGPYLLCKGFCMALDRMGGLMGNVPVKCYNRDLANSGWREAPRRAPAVQLSPDWAERLRPRSGA